MLSGLIARLKMAYGRTAGAIVYALFRRTSAVRLEYLGSDYGGWRVAPDLLPSGSLALCIGAGEDVSFDVALNGRFGVDVVCVDPTPRAVAHVERLLGDHRSGRPASIGVAPAAYDLNGFSAGRFKLLPYAVWSSDGDLKFYEPSDRRHVSYSAVDMQRTGQYIHVPARRVASILKEIGAGRPHLIKMDIEGAEYEVLRDLRESAILPAQLLVEFEEVNRPRSPMALLRLGREVQALRDQGYRLVACARSNFLFVLESVLA